jgi:hypothetical protein
MKKQVICSLLILSWISGISLTCIFPPVPDFQANTKSSSFLSVDASPEVYQISNPNFRSTHGDQGFSLLSFLVGNSGFQSRGRIKVFNSTGGLDEIPSLFDTKILIEAFFETW